ncbi:hypothetical protein HOK22_00975 [Candidatus Peregrinibacteria bacterium]|nr:hypothetical protein [Candidatus Peregrinibacteria bacterium]
MKKFLAIFLLSSIAFTACSTIQSEPKRAAMAMAETSCLLFDENIDFTKIGEQTSEIMEKYGYEDNAKIDDYLVSIADTEELNEVSVELRTALETNCGDLLTESGIDAADLAEAIVFE